MGNNDFQGSISAEDNILHAISLIDRSMSQMVTVNSKDGGNALRDKFVAMRLQIDNLQAKCDHLLPDKTEFEEFNEEKDEFEDFTDEIPDFYEKIQKAKKQYREDDQNNSVTDLKATRKYFTSTLEAIYSLLARKGIYQAVGEKSVEEQTVDPTKNEQVDD